VTLFVQWQFNVRLVARRINRRLLCALRAFAVENRISSETKSMSISAEQVRWIAHLARLEMPAAELDILQRDLNAIVEYVNLLQTLNTDGVEPLAHTLDLANVFRDDVPVPSLPVDEILANAPQRQDDFYAVPAVLD
jgi:aspartyl-tRNA(Asn)/glutamyl-tRNA(Gln) amidotransferase subunit C